MKSSVERLRPLEHKVWLSSPTMHGEELTYMRLAYDTNWMSSVGENINVIERQVADLVGCKCAVALNTGTAALHLIARLAGVRPGEEVLCSDVTFAATVNPVVYEGGVPVFVDSERDTWNMDPAALEQAFRLHPTAKLVSMAHLYGTPAKMDELRAVASAHGARIIEDAAEAFGATYRGQPVGTFGDYGAISFNGNKIVTGSAGGMFLTNSKADADKVHKWCLQSSEAATSWYQHEELGFNYRMSNVVAGVVRGQLPHLREHMAQKKVIYERYRDGFRDLPVTMNPFDATKSSPNYWLSCILIDADAMCPQVRGEKDVLYQSQSGKSCPTEILEGIAHINAQGRPVWKPMHLQPLYRGNAFVTREGTGRAPSLGYVEGVTPGEDGLPLDVGADLFARGLCLPSDNKMTPEAQDRIIEVVKECFR